MVLFLHRLVCKCRLPSLRRLGGSNSFKIRSHVFPMIIRGNIALDRQLSLVLIAQNLHENVVTSLLTIEHKLQVAGHREEAIIGPSADGYLLQVGHLHSRVIEIEQTCERHHHGVVTVTQCSTGMIQLQAAVGFMDNLTQKEAL